MCRTASQCFRRQLLQCHLIEALEETLPSSCLPARLLILDDSTSALDVATESRVQDAIPQFAPGMTTIYVAQRISAVLDLDQIYLLANGEIVAQGSHEELMKSSPLYLEIYESQLGSDVLAGVEEEVTA